MVVIGQESYAHCCNAVHAVPLEVQELLDEVAIHKVLAVQLSMLVVEGAPLCMAEAADTLDDSPQAILYMPFL